MARGLGGEDALQLAMACGAANAMLGEVGSVRMEDVQRLVPLIALESIAP